VLEKEEKHNRSFKGAALPPPTLALLLLLLSSTNQPLHNITLKIVIDFTPPLRAIRLHRSVLCPELFQSSWSRLRRY